MSMSVGNLPSYTSTNVSAIKKAIETQEVSMAKLLQSASSQNAQSSMPESSGTAKSIAAEATQRGASLDLMA